MWKWLFLVELSSVLVSFAHSDPAEKFVKAIPQGSFPYEHSHRTEWNYVPMDRTGMSYQMMSPAQKEVADAFCAGLIIW